MDQDIRLIYSSFNQEVTRHFLSLINEFTNEADSLEKDSGENAFQVLRAKYLSQLKQHLNKSANTMMNKYEEAETRGRLRINFTDRINYFMKEFVRKSELIQGR